MREIIPGRILVVLPMYGGSLPIGQYCAKALVNLGNSVRVFDSSKLYNAYTGLKELDIGPRSLAPLETSFLRFVNQAIWAMIQEQKPDLVLALAQAPLDKIMLGRLKREGIKTVMWFVEDYKVFNYWRAFAPLYDAFAVIQKEPFLSELEKIGQTHAFYLPLAALPEFHKPVKLDEKEKLEYGSDISFLGAGYPNRRIAFRPLAKANFKIWGSDWEGEKFLSKNIQRQGKRINAEESVKIYNSSLININLHSNIYKEKLVSHDDFVNPRTFELAAIGAFQIVDKRTLMPELFAEDELATFNDIEEFYDKIDYYLKDKDAMEKIIKKSRERVLKDHTYEKRMERLLTYILDNFGPWPSQSDQAELSSQFPKEIHEKIKELAKKFGLSPAAQFDDVIARLRKESGELNETEVAILFLDEWKKQYSS